MNLAIEPTLPKTRVWTSAQDRVHHVWSEPTLTRSLHPGYDESCSGTASGSVVFLSEDPKPWADPLRNRYRYVINSPVFYIDPMGTDYIPAPIFNADNKPYIGFGEPGRRKPGQILPIPPRTPFPGQPPGPGMTPPWWDVDFICTDSGWVKVRGPALIVNGMVIGWTPPVPPDWKPPFECPRKECPL